MKTRFSKLPILSAGLAALAAGLTLSGCHDRNTPPPPTTNAPSAAEIARENELKAREDAVAQREAEVQRQTLERDLTGEPDVEHEVRAPEDGVPLFVTTRTAVVVKFP